MGKPTGFIDYARDVAADRPASERVGDYEYIHKTLSCAERKKQAGRCMDCGVPFCEMNIKLDGVSQGCPLHNLIPEWNGQLWNENLHLALDRLTQTNCFPEFTGYVCPALCERACSCNKTSSPVTVNDNERYIIDSAFEKGLVKAQIPAKRSGKTVAVVGSGPAGLTVACLLNQRGHSVTVYERSATPGGLLVYGIPNMKLPKDVVARRIALLEEEGVQFICNANVGDQAEGDLSVADLAQQYDAVVMAIGAQQPRVVKFDGQAEGVYFALNYLNAAAQDFLGEAALPAALNAQDKTVAIIGAGDTASDCIATALRQGVKDVVQLIRRPAADYGTATDYAHVESEAVLGRDIRCFESQIAAVKADENGTLCSIMVNTPEGEVEKEAQMLIIASGFVGAETYALEGVDIQSCENVFQAGDMELGASLVVSAMAHARKAAYDVDVFLTGYSTLH